MIRDIKNDASNALCHLRDTRDFQHPSGWCKVNKLISDISVQARKPLNVGIRYQDYTDPGTTGGI